MTARPGGRSRGGHEHEIEPVRQAREACYALRRLHRERPALDPGPAALGPRRRPSRTPSCRRLRAAGLPALEGHRPQRPAEHSSTKLTYVLVRPGARPAPADRRTASSSCNRVERQGITATRRRRPRAGQRGRRRRADRTSGHHPRRHPPAQPRRGPRRSGQRQDLPRHGAGPSARPARTAGRAGLLLPRAGVLPGTHHRDLAAPPTARLRRRVPRLGKQWGAPEGPDEVDPDRGDRAVLGARPAAAKWPTLQRNSNPGTGSTRSWSTRRRTSPTRGGTRCWPRCKDDETGGIYVFTDEGQRVFNRHGSPPVPLVPLILDHNLRNTRQIANAFQPLRRSPDALPRR